MFKFKFSSPSNNSPAVPSCEATSERNDNLIWLSAEHLYPCEDHILDEDSISIYTCGPFILKYHNIDSSIVKVVNAASHITLAEQNQSDLLPAKYEGGLKIWECTYDLLKYLLNKFSDRNLSECKILDLGCGAGLLGIFFLKLNASVTFQDYNKEVLDTTTIPNVLLNLSSEERKFLLDNNDQQCQFYSGDWGSFVECLQNTTGIKDGYFDYILTSETIYNPANHHKLILVFKNCLKKNGTVYLAAKTHYFGVGGGTRQFEDNFISGSDLVSNVCWKSEGGVQREILEIKFKE